MDICFVFHSIKFQYVRSSSYLCINLTLLLYDLSLYFISIFILFSSCPSFASSVFSYLSFVSFLFSISFYLTHSVFLSQHLPNYFYLYDSFFPSSHYLYLIISKSFSLSPFYFHLSLFLLHVPRQCVFSNLFRQGAVFFRTPERVKNNSHYEFLLCPFQRTSAPTFKRN